MENQSLHRFTFLLATATLFLIVAGGLVVSHEAGLSVPDWPLSYGKVMPPMEGGVFYEHGHRMVATAVGFLTVVLAIWIQRVEKRKWLKKLAWIAVASVIFQGVLGGLTVLYLLPKAISISHACLAQLFFSATVAIAFFTSTSWHREDWILTDSGWPSMRSMAVIAPVLTLIQVALGAAFRHKVLGILPHVLGAFVVTMVLVYFALIIQMQYTQSPLMRKTAMSLTWVTLIQVVLGIAAYLTRLSITGNTPTSVMVGFTVAHVATGALTLALTIALSILTLRFIHKPQEAADPHAARA